MSLLRDCTLVVFSFLLGLRAASGTYQSRDTEKSVCENRQRHFHFWIYYLFAVLTLADLCILYFSIYFVLLIADRIT